jgi:hypothetical protein
MSALLAPYMKRDNFARARFDRTETGIGLLGFLSDHVYRRLS